jgi:hypothetical protein
MPISTTRRNLLSIGAAAGMMNLLAPQSANAAEQTPAAPLSLALNVMNYGALADAATDNTAAFQHALDAAQKAGGGTVYAPPGGYLFRGTLTVPEGVTLRGSYGCALSHTGIRDRNNTHKPGADGTALFIAAGKGSEVGTPFVTLNSNSTLAGLTLYYPEQLSDAIPLAYPWAIAMRGENPAVLDVELLNPFQGIDASKNSRHNIRNVTGQPLRRGIWVDAIYDIGRIENVHFNPWWNNKEAFQWQMENGEAFVFARSDWEYVFNTFCFGYRVGYKFVQSAVGSCNGNFLGIGADNCNRAVLVEQCTQYGLLITNGEFTSFKGPDPTMVEVLDSNKGVVRFSNSAFWGGCTQIAKIAGTGTVGFSDCTFVEWGKESGPAAIQANSGSVLIRGCEFRKKKQQVYLGKGVASAVVTGNLFAGPEQIENRAGKHVQIGLNSSSV